MKHLPAATLILLHVLVVSSTVDELSVAPDDPSVYDSAYEEMTFKTAVFNAYPDTSISAFVTFKNNKVSRLRYGELRTTDVSMAPYADFIIQFRQGPTDAVLSSYTDYGFMDGDIKEDSDVVLVITRAINDPLKPRHHLMTFDMTTVDADSSKLYIFNGIWNSKHTNEDKGLNMYGLYQRYNFDGSQSESITLIATNVLFNSGLDTSLEPGISLDIKGFYDTIKSVNEFKTTQPVVHYREYIATAGERNYLITYGDHGNSNSTGHVMLIDRSALLTASSISVMTTINPSLLLYCISIAILIILMMN